MFLALQPVPAVGCPDLGTFNIQHPVELGFAKIMLLRLCRIVEVKPALISNVTFTQPEAGMQVVMDNPRLGQAVALSSLLRQTFIITKDHNPNNVRSREISMIHVLKLMTSHLLLGNLATNGVTNIYNEANLVNPSVFLP